MSPKPISDNTLLGWFAGERRLETGWRWAELRRPFTGIEASKQAAGSEERLLVRPGSSGQVRGRLTRARAPRRAGRPP